VEVERTTTLENCQETARTRDKIETRV